MVSLNGAHSIFRHAVIKACRLKLQHHSQLSCFTPKSRDVILFPGQGSQFVGMTAGLTSIPEVKHLFETANRVLGYDLLELCQNGPKSELDRTVHCQPAIFVTSFSVLEKLKQICGKGWYEEQNTVTAGFSVGELAALVFSKALTFENGLRLVDIRAKAMQKASDENPSRMVSVTGLTKEEIETIVKSVHVFFKDVEITIASYLYAKGFVLAGEREAIDYLQEIPVSKDENSDLTELVMKIGIDLKIE